jgi:autotransporter-associated beta strand protein
MLFAVLMALVSMAVDAQQLAFPGAQGWGRFATGGRNGSVYHVTNLNDSGSGSLRDAVSQANRIIVFDVAGVIRLTSGRIVFKNNLYVAGQTAPGEGITVYGDGVSFSGANNIIVRHMRFRMGRVGTKDKDCAGIANGQNMIFDHCSFAWGQDETFSINPDGKGVGPDNITLQNCVIGQGLLDHSAGGLMQADYITLYRNLYIDNSTRNNKIKGKAQYVNNVVYNWKNGCVIMGGDSSGESYVNIESNLFVNGPANGGNGLGGGNSLFHFYGNDNWQDSNMDGVFSPSLVTTDGGGDRVSTPYDYPELEKYKGNELLEKNIPTVGATLPYRDMTDCYMIDELMSYGTKGALISNEESLVYGTPSTWSVYAGVKKQDSDNDGMPDAWEDANGTDKTKNDAMTKAANGYANIENYINSITVDDRDFFLRKPVALVLDKASTQTLTISWRDYTYDEDGFAIELKTTGDYQEVARTEANASSTTISGLEPGTKYSVRVRAFKGDKTSEYAVTEMSTRPVEVGIIDVDSYEADYTWTGGAFDTDAAAQKNVLLAPTANETLSLTASVEPTAVVYNVPANTTVSGTGSFSGAMSMNKAGKGTLTLNNTNAYKGATVLHDGVLEFSSLKNGGENSAIGSSTEFAQNWIADGGTYRYTGGTTTTNRSMKLSQTSTFDVKSATVTMNGVIEGSDASVNFVIDGGGQINVGTTKFFGYKGATVLKGASLYLPTAELSNNGIGSSSKLVMAGGHLKTKGETSGYETYSFPIEVQEGTTSQFSPNRNCYIKSKVSGSGTIQLNIPYLREYVQGDWSEFNGRLIANGMSSDKRGSLMLLDGSPKMNNTVIELKGNANLCYWSTTGNQTIGGISGVAGTYINGSGKQTDNFTCTWTVGSANTDETFAGIINNWSCSGSGHVGTVNIVKTGTGLWRLTGKNEYKGTTTVNGGTLIVNGQHTGTGLVTVAKGATLAGKGTLAGAVTVNGTLLVGDEGATDKGLTIKGKLTLGSGAILELNEAMQAKTYTNGQTIQAFTGTATGTFAEIIPATPGEGQSWDTTELYTKGVLKVSGEGQTPVDPTPVDPTPDTNKKYKRQIQYSWESPAGTEIQTGGTAVMMNAPSDAPDRVNYVNGTYYTISLNGKYANMNDATASANSTFIQINLNEALAAGDSVWVTAYQNKGTEAEASPYIVAGSCVINDGVKFNDVANGETPNLRSYVLTDGAAGEKVLKMTRGSKVGTNLFIVKLVISRWVEDNGTTPDDPTPDPQPKTKPVVTAPVGATGLTADGTPKVLIATPATTTGGTVEYSLDGTTWSTALPQASAAGSYTVNYRVKGNDDYEDVAPATITVTIALPSAIRTIGTSADDAAWYTLEGQKLNGEPAGKGVYIHRGQVVVKK